MPDKSSDQTYYSKELNLKFIDLTQIVGLNIPKLNFPKFEAEVTSSHDTRGVYARTVKLSEHLGTHVDAPTHFAKGQINIDKVPLSQLIGPAAVINIADKVERNPDYRLNLNDLKAWETKNGEVVKGAFVLLATGWDKYWHDPDKSKYLNADSKGVEHFPGIDKEVFEFLAEKRDIRGLGTDCFRPEGGLGPSTIPGKMVPRVGHNVLCPAGKLIIENLKNLTLLPPTGAVVIFGVVPYEDGSGAQARILAVLK